MEKTRVISVRLPESLINELEQAVSQHTYWKRNAIIEKALEAFLHAADVHTQYAILHWWRHGNKKAELTFREIKVSESKPDFESGV